ncbi:MAG: Smr/MutS family protein, partial [Acidobacteriota bacterium]
GPGSPPDRGARGRRRVSFERARRDGDEVPAEIHLRGLSVDEALARVDKYLDDASLAGLDTARLVHGVGSGRLKRAIAELLHRHPHVRGFSSAPADRGGAGVTVVTLRT